MSLSRKTTGGIPEVKGVIAARQVVSRAAVQDTATHGGSYRARVLDHTYLTIGQVMAHLGVARSTVEQLPVEILPYIDLSPSIDRQLKRYHPDDVAAAPALIRAWKRAQQGRRGEAFLAEQRKLLEERDHAAITSSRGARAVAA